MNKIWTNEAWEDYSYWQMNDKKVARRINHLVQNIERYGHSGHGNPEPLRHGFDGFWSRRIEGNHRLVYLINDEGIAIVQCKLHSSDN